VEPADARRPRGAGRRDVGEGAGEGGGHGTSRTDARSAVPGSRVGLRWDRSPRTLSPVRRWWLAVVALVAVACSPSARAAAPAPPPLPADPARPAVILSSDDEPNPFVLVDHGTTYLYASQPSFFGPNIQVRSG